MTFDECLVTFLAYDELGTYALARLNGWWPADVRHREANSLATAIRAVEAAGLVEAYVPREGRPLRYHGGVRVPRDDEHELWRTLENGRPPVLLEATAAGQNQVDLAMASPSDRRAAAVFPDPEYAPEESWGGASLWPNRFARHVGDRVRAGSQLGGSALDTDQLRERYTEHVQEAYPDDPGFLGALTYFDVLCGMLWRGDDEGVGAWVRTVVDRGAALPPTADWTIDTVRLLDVFDPVA